MPETSYLLSPITEPSYIEGEKKSEDKEKVAPFKAS